MKDTWHSCNLGDAMLAADALEDIKTRFLSMRAAAVEPEGMAVFMRHVSEGRLHCEVHVYFPPAAFELARLSGAAPCSRPSPDGLGLLAGPETCWQALFPGRSA